MQNPFGHTCYIFDLHNFFATLQRIREGNTHIQELKTETLPAMKENHELPVLIWCGSGWEKAAVSMMIFEKNHFVAVHFQLMCDVLDCPCQSVYGIE